jgi:hypothetical protein
MIPDQFWPNRKFTRAKDWLLCPPPDMEDTRAYRSAVNTFGTPSVSRGITSLAWRTYACTELELRHYDCPVLEHGMKGYLGT